MSSNCHLTWEVHGRQLHGGEIDLPGQVEVLSDPPVAGEAVPPLHLSRAQQDDRGEDEGAVQGVPFVQVFRRQGGVSIGLSLVRDVHQRG